MRSAGRLFSSASLPLDESLILRAETTQLHLQDRPILFAQFDLAAREPDELRRDVELARGILPDPFLSDGRDGNGQQADA